ncbi:uncharacterized protein LY79DRAFT_88763 [Colletotrichum navitas]|uniref:Uncharacterized protein n=1 Tax=Colletotrichum navitas TaxID=681940 RepID=A0AAD8Q521_9PEZI|nr:uncharacterized protein LY79DRAFT_88763 [Colletotrichum navitas]KAK1595704.1 hypothetical protein LY79DRAFT_88763 [Colletotrichum navitas]
MPSLPTRIFFPSRPRPCPSPSQCFACGVSLSPSEVGIGQDSPTPWSRLAAPASSKCDVHAAERSQTPPDPAVAVGGFADLSLPKHSLQNSALRPSRPLLPPSSSSSCLSPHPHAMQYMCMRSHVLAKATPTCPTYLSLFHYECACTRSSAWIREYGSLV